MTMHPHHAPTGQTHIRRTLAAGEWAKANRREHAVVSRIKAISERLGVALGKAQERGISFAKARAWPEQWMAAEARDGEGRLHEVGHDLIINKAEARLYGTCKAKQWLKVATMTSDPLAEPVGKWLNVSDCKPAFNIGVPGPAPWRAGMPRGR
jgi:hypothetical protein